jgi:hypothetical protein
MTPLTERIEARLASGEIATARFVAVDGQLKIHVETWREPTPDDEEPLH